MITIFYIDVFNSDNLWGVTIDFTNFCYELAEGTFNSYSDAERFVKTWLVDKGLA